jgi:hypothetical protein
VGGRASRPRAGPHRLGRPRLGEAREWRGQPSQRGTGPTRLLRSGSVPSGGRNSRRR